jgi:dolichol kinase
MFAFSFAGILIGTLPLVDRPALLPALGAAVAATLAEAPAGNGKDNLTVPAAGALAFWALQGLTR